MDDLTAIARGAARRIWPVRHKMAPSGKLWSEWFSDHFGKSVEVVRAEYHAEREKKWKQETK